MPVSFYLDICEKQNAFPVTLTDVVAEVLVSPRKCYTKIIK